ncbi:MAG: sigma-70 family RNA polymerase sigma factor [Verrucomicrobiales bacterium]|nr:sigma-70 family RNA polymerase sigma factor [Verrucomicrobiales bacterium]
MAEQTFRPGEPQIPDEALVDQVLQGEVSAYDWLVLRYQERLYAVIYHMTANHEDTNDLLMETFDKAFRRLSSYKKNSSFYTWIYRIALNHTVNHLNRGRKRRYDLSLNELSVDEATEQEFADLSAVTGAQAAARVELQNKLNESLKNLSESQRAAVVLFDIEGMGHAEIAKIMHCSEGTVRSRLHYAHRYLQKALASWLNK